MRPGGEETARRDCRDFYLSLCFFCSVYFFGLGHCVFQAQLVGTFNPFIEEYWRLECRL